MVGRRDGASVIYSLRVAEIAELLAVAKRVLILSLVEAQSVLDGLRVAAGEA